MQQSSIDRVPLAGAIVAALVSALCCVVPFVLVSVGITGPWLARLQVFEPYRIPLDVASLVVVTVGWGVHVARVRSCRPGDGCAFPQRLRRTRMWLLIVTFVVVAIVQRLT
jgi:mercuric ion transport protein